MTTESAFFGRVTEYVRSTCLTLYLMHSVEHITKNLSEKTEN